MHNVLITKELNNKQRALASDYGLKVTELPFIKIKFEYDTVEVPFAEAWIVTSVNGAKYIDAHFDDFPKEKLPKVIFAIGESTAERIKNLNIPIEMPKYGTAENVAELVLASGVQSAVLFTGNLRRNILPDTLKDEIEFTEFFVYETELLNHQLDMEDFDGIAFFSPSGVKAFTQANQINGHKIIAIGTVTRQAVQEHLNVRAGIPATPKVEDVLFALKEDLNL